jgi:hypothetical protein
VVWTSCSVVVDLARVAEALVAVAMASISRVGVWPGGARRLRGRGNEAVCLYRLGPRRTRKTLKRTRERVVRSDAFPAQI